MHAFDNRFCFIVIIFGIVPKTVSEFQTGVSIVLSGIYLYHNVWSFLFQIWNDEWD